MALSARQQAHLDLVCELVAFQSQAPHTVRRGLAAMEANPVLVEECPAVFGMPFPALKEGLTALVNLDREYESENLFA